MFTLLRTTVLSIRTTMVRPFRRRRLQQLCQLRAAPIMVLFYHRVANTYLNEWSISFKKFKQHLDLIQKDFEFIDMAEVQRRVRENDSPRPAIHLTFDDGYSDNCDQAIPEVIRRGIPCTYFVTLENVLSGQPFEHDLRRGVPIPPNTLAQLRWMSCQGIEIGAHTRNHRDMGLVTPENISNEISDCANELSGLICQPIRYFAFPYGLAENMPPAAIADVISAGMQGFCSAFGGYNLPGRDWFHIRRIHGDPALARLKNWLSFDPRKLRLEPTVEYPQPDLPYSFSTFKLKPGTTPC